jgi:O-methyltransferase involved in polyketide biosynthesis
MDTKKIDVDLHGVPQTLLIPLFARAKFSQEPNSPLHDQRAIELVNELKYDFNHILKEIPESALFLSMVRAYRCDEAVKEFLKNHPQAVIVNLGAGLETSFYRVDNGQLTWIDLDLPEVIALRRKLLPPPDRVHYIAKSVHDFSWMDDVKQYGNEVFFFAAGFFFYFTEEQVKSIFIHIGDHFPQAELIFDMLSKKGVDSLNIMFKNANDENTLSHWSLDDGKVLETWSPNIKLVSQQSFFKGIKNKSAFPLYMRLRGKIYDLYNLGWYVHLKFG